MALASLLLQPEGKLPPLIIIDEPELGLHPYAITVIAGLLKSVSFQAQVLLATQSTAFVDSRRGPDVQQRIVNIYVINDVLEFLRREGMI